LDLELKDKIVCVTGSTRGIGRSIANEFLREGARVAISGRTQEDLDRVTSEFKDRWGQDRVLSFQGDVTLKEDIKAYIERIEKRWKGLDILVANLGSGKGPSGWKIELEEWQEALQLNLIGASLIVNQAVPLMRSRGGGTIIFISSLAGVESLPAPISYSCAKSGIVTLGKLLSRSLSEENIRVNVVAPGNIFFPGGVWERKFNENPSWVKEYINAEVPVKRLGSPEDIAHAVMFLSSARASFLTGACMVVDGGQSKGW